MSQKHVTDYTTGNVTKAWHELYHRQCHKIMSRIIPPVMSQKHITDYTTSNVTKACHGLYHQQCHKSMSWNIPPVMSQKHVTDYTTSNVTKICILASGTKAVLSLYNIESTVHCVMYITILY